MFTAMIIDDERLVREGIRELIDWEKAGFRLGTSGKDGREGLANILREKPDLVLVDIKMPGLSGLEVIKEAKKQGFSGHFIILTGFSEFEYARTALTMGVGGYLLKPIDEDELLEHVEKVRESLEKAICLEQYHSQNEGRARQELFRRMVLKEGDPEELKRDVEKYHLELEGDIFCIAVCKEEEGQPDRESGRLHEKIKTLIEGDSSCMETFPLEDQVILVGRSIEYGKWKERLEKRNKRVEGYFGKKLKIALGNNVRQWQELFCSYESARYLMDQAFIFDEEDILTIDLICTLEGRGREVTMEWLEMLIEVGEAEGIKKAMEMFKDYCTWNLLKESEIKMILVRNMVQLQMRLSQKYTAASLNQGAMQQLLDRIAVANGMKDLLDCYEQALIGLSREIGTAGGSIIRRVYYYMEKNYDKDLKLEGIAKNFNYNSAYLGKLFRREMGENFNNALDRIRIANARRLLKDTGLKVYQISEMVGYGSIDYFYMKFKKYVGISPKDYRKTIETECENTNKNDQ